jgi:hypothetical protein
LINLFSKIDDKLNLLNNKFDKFDKFIDAKTITNKDEAAADDVSFRLSYL